MKKILLTILLLGLAQTANANAVSDWWDSLFGDDIQNIEQDVNSNQTNVQGDTTIGDTITGDTTVSQGSLSVSVPDSVLIKNFIELTDQMANSTETTAKAIQGLTWQVSQNTKQTADLIKQVIEDPPTLTIQTASSSPLDVDVGQLVEINNTLQTINIMTEELIKQLSERVEENEEELEKLNRNLSNLRIPAAFGGGGGSTSTTSTTLHKVSMGTNTTGGAQVTAVVTTIGTGYSVLDLADAEFNAVYDPNSLIVTADNSITVTQAGDYEISYAQTLAATSQDLGIYIDGVLLQTYRVGTASVGYGYSVITALTAGQKIEFRTPTTAITPAITVEQLPTTVAVDAAALVPTTLSRIQVGTSVTLNSAGATHYAFDETDFIQGTDLALSGTGSVTGLQAGKTYRITANVQQFLGGTSAVKQIFRIVNLTTNTQIGEQLENFREFGMASQVVFITPTATTEVGLDYDSGNVGEISPKSNFIVEELVESSVAQIAVTDLAVDDQTASGYFDSGTKREQIFDQTLINSDSPITITMPQAMGNTTYFVGWTSDSNSNDSSVAIPFTISNKTTTTFDIDRDDNFTGFTPTISFFVWGLKP